MREIKFRYKVKGRINLLYDTNEDDFGYLAFGRKMIAGCMGEIFEVEDEQQYTGLKDKNGVEIYESDLITHHSRNSGNPHPVVFNEELAAWCGDYRLKYPLQISELDEIEVIGNIHENKELLNEK